MAEEKSLEESSSGNENKNTNTCDSYGIIPDDFEDVYEKEMDTKYNDEEIDPYSVGGECNVSS